MKYKPKRKFSSSTRYLLSTQGWIFYLIWRNDKKFVSNFKNSRIYELKVFPNFHNKLKEHIIKLSQDPYERDYNAIISE